MGLANVAITSQLATTVQSQLCSSSTSALKLKTDGRTQNERLPPKPAPSTQSFGAAVLASAVHRVSHPPHTPTPSAGRLALGPGRFFGSIQTADSTAPVSDPSLSSSSFFLFRAPSFRFAQPSAAIFADPDIWPLFSSATPASNDRSPDWPLDR